jgi:hypothetical protein
MTEDNSCLELKNIQYRTLLTGNIPHSLEQQIDITTDTKQLNKLMRSMAVTPKKKKTPKEHSMPVVDIKANLKKQRGRKTKKQIMEELIDKTKDGYKPVDISGVEIQVVPWSKLDKSMKIHKINDYIDNIYSVKHSLTKEEISTLKQYIKTTIDRKRLCKTKDVIYEEEQIKDIPSLFYRNEESLPHRFTLKVMDKTNTTLKNMTPRKKKKVVIMND